MFLKRETRTSIEQERPALAATGKGDPDIEDPAAAEFAFIGEPPCAPVPGTA